LSIYEAFQEQLGLKLERGKAQADVLVIDKLERPSESLFASLAAFGPPAGDDYHVRRVIPVTARFGTL
jgi:hypothetical protein